MEMYKVFDRRPCVLIPGPGTRALGKQFVGFKSFLVCKAGARFGIAGKEDTDAFNCRESNLRGERFRVLVGESKECGEGFERAGAL